MRSTRDESVLVTGGTGLIGSHLVRSASRLARGRAILAPPRNEVELTDFGRVETWFQENQPSAVIHCAALSRASACEADPALAERLNVVLTRHLAGLSRTIPFVFFSSDLVFDGETGNYLEEDSVGPLNTYSRTKVAAEEIVRGHPRHLIIRTSLNYGFSPAGDRSFNEEIAQAWKQGRALTFFTDEFRSPIPAEITARSVWELLNCGATGTFHVAGAQRLSRWEIAELLLRRHPEFRALAQRGSLKDFTGPRRAADTSLNCAKAQALLSFPLPKFSEWIETQGKTVS